MAYSCYMTPFPTILALRNSWIHISSLNCSNEASYIEASVYDLFCIRTTLRVPNVDPDDRHVGFRGNLDDVRSRSEDDVVKDVVTSENAFNII